MPIIWRLIQEKIMSRNLFSFLGCGSSSRFKVQGSKITVYNLKLHRAFVFAFFLTFYLQLLTFNLKAQKPTGKFLTDSVEIGKPILYAFSYRHHFAQEVFFPDTTYDFYPFELKKRDFFPTNTSKNISTDSVIYTLVTFEIDKVQRLALPIYAFANRDCTAVFSMQDSVFLKEMLGSNLNLPLKTNTSAVEVPLSIDYPKILGYLLSLVGVIGLIYTLFGKYIRKKYNQFLFTRKHRDFVNNYKKTLRGELNDKNISKALVAWKKHLEWLEKRPFSSFTTKEIIQNIPNERLEDALKDVDSAIYGGILSTQMPLAMGILLDTAIDIYKKQKEYLYN
jgi:hypothetical protein